MRRNYYITAVCDGQRRIRFHHLTEEKANFWYCWLLKNEPESEPQMCGAEGDVEAIIEGLPNLTEEQIACVRQIVFEFGKVS